MFFLYSCNDVERGPVEMDNIAPGQITNVSVIPQPGGAIIEYELPSDPDLLCVEAKYTLPNGDDILINASNGTRSIKLEGFLDIMEYDINITCVDKSGNRSETLVVKITPELAPVKAVLQDMSITPDFGGLNLKWSNPSEADLAILIFMKNKEGKFENIDTYYTSNKVGNYSVRGLEDVESEFAIQLRDKWGNFSEQKTATLTPIFEEQISPENLSLLDFVYTSNIEYGDMSRLPKMWDEQFDDLVTKTSKVPWHASFSISPKPIKLSRIIIWQFAWSSNNYGHYYAAGNGSLYEIYGSSVDVPNTNINDDDWVKLATLPIVKPSGLPNLIGRDYMTDEDFDLAHNKGHEVAIPMDAPPVKHICVKSLKCFGGVDGTFSEIYIFANTKMDK